MFPEACLLIPQQLKYVFVVFWLVGWLGERGIPMLNICFCGWLVGWLVGWLGERGIPMLNLRAAVKLPIIFLSDMFKPCFMMYTG
jgi:hypothetical protein